MKVMFCKISGMKYYKGHCSADVPVNGGKYVGEHGYGHEEYNFSPFDMEDSIAEECIGFVEPKSYQGYRNTFHIEKIEGCASYKNAPFVDDVLVIWCATRIQGDTTVVGWYKHATVWRDLQDWTLSREDGEEERVYNVRAKATDCTLLPEGERNRHDWFVPSAKYTKAYGFGQAMVWYPTEPEAQQYLSRLLNCIENYHDENWLDKYPEQ